MSTICKLDPEVRRARTMRANLLRMRATNSWQIRILTELKLIHDHSGLTGATKQMLFVRGAAQLARLGAQ